MIRFLVGLCLLVVGIIPVSCVAAKEPAIVFAASSLTDVLDELSEAYAANPGNSVPVLAFGASATMARQIEAGAPATLFISANPIWTQSLKNSGKVIETRHVASNSLVLAGAGISPLKTIQELKEFLYGKRLAIADPALAPAGAYAEDFLKKIGRPGKLQLVRSANARQTLRLAQTSGIPAFIYGSDAQASNDVDIIFRIPHELADTIIYEAALLVANQETVSFLDFMLSDSARNIWEKSGFGEIASN